ncbi:MAG TPA: glycerol-3-phosphate dehydrogenase/oxidase [Tepidiformaceae bacterium]
MNLAELAAGPALDVVVIGGGINGCAITAEAARRGLRVALFEQDDFGFGTTWRTTKLIHGGLRYLEHGDARLVFESLRERAWLLKTRPHLVLPQRFVLPVLPWTRRPAWQLQMGLSLYDLLAMYRGVPSHRKLSEARLHELAPALPAGTRRGFTFFDARAIAPERLAVELAMEGERAGAFIQNHATVRRIEVADGHVRSVEVEASGERFTIQTKAVVNAAGPWVDAVNAVAEMPRRQLLGVTKGTHIVFETGAAPGRDAVFSTARADGRVIFAVPQGDLLLVGTTDEHFSGDPGDIRPTTEDIDYLLEEAQALLPGLDLQRDQIRYAYAGVRPLQKVGGGPESAITRRHAVIDHGKDVGAAGLFSVIGGKLSTFRPLANDVMKALDAPSVHATPPEPSREWRDVLAGSGLPAKVMAHLRIYGPSVRAVIEDSNGILCEHAHAIDGEIRHAVSEHATSLSDILMRRTGIAWSSCRGLCCKERTAEIAGSILGWDEAERSRQVAAFEADVARHLPTAQSLAAEHDDDGQP